jgi:hypothetical protein
MTGPIREFMTVATVRSYSPLRDISDDATETNASGAASLISLTIACSCAGLTIDHNRDMANDSTPLSSSFPMACRALSRLSWTTTAPSNATRSSTSCTSCLATSGSGLPCTATWAIVSGDSPTKRPPACIMKRESRCPRVVIKPTLAARFSTRAFVPTVHP